jgi:hypothetical protein
MMTILHFSTAIVNHCAVEVERLTMNRESWSKTANIFEVKLLIF